MMDLDEFQDFLDTHGPDPATWPAEDRRQAEALLGRSAAARAALAEAQRLDSLLARTLATERASEALRARILATAAGHARPAAAREPWRFRFAPPWWIGAASATASLLLGIYVGVSGLPPFVPSEPPPAAGEIVDVADLAFGAAIDEETFP